jgi:hypothetical protein
MVAKANKSPYLVKKRIVDGIKTTGYVLENRGKEQKIDREELIKLVEQNPNSVLVDIKGAKDKPVYLTVTEETKKDGNIKKLLRTMWDDTIKNNLNQVKPIKASTGNKLKIFKVPEKQLVAV